MRILVADDEKLKRVTLAQDLAAQGHDVLTAADGAEAWERLRGEQFDVLVIDQTVIGCSPAIRRVRRLIEICTRSDANVLIYGETGVGKDLVASTIHANSPRRRSPFIKVGCTLFPSQLIESELYGHERGSFTGADQRRPGRFELAEGGTLYLDDVDDIPLEHQAKLLRAIEEIFRLESLTYSPSGERR